MQDSIASHLIALPEIVGTIIGRTDEEPMGWTYLERYDQHWLKIDGREVALISKRVPGDWLVHMNRHREWRPGMRCTGVSPTVSHGKRMIERLALVNLSRLRAEIAALPRQVGLRKLHTGESDTMRTVEPREPPKHPGKPRRFRRRR